MRVIVTCGPSHAPIDEVRRITNFSTGRLGALLSCRLTDAGHEVICLRGEMATYCGECRAAQVIPFSTNDDLLEKLEQLARAGGVGVVLHAAALGDFTVRRPGTERKLWSGAGEITLTLVPATKILPRLRPLFGEARIVGWKYELDGSREDALARGRAQLAQCGTDACVVNGAAYGEGFGLLAGNGMVRHLDDADALGAWLVDWLSAVPAR